MPPPPLRLPAAKPVLPRLLPTALWTLQTKPTSAPSAWLKPAAPASRVRLLLTSRRYGGLRSDPDGNPLQIIQDLTYPLPIEIGSVVAGLLLHHQLQ